MIITSHTGIVFAECPIKVKCGTLYYLTSMSDIMLTMYVTTYYLLLAFYMHIRILSIAYRSRKDLATIYVMAMTVKMQ